VSQLIQVERSPETRLRTQQSALQQKNSAYTSIGTQLGTLATSLKTLNDATLFNSRQTTLSDSTVATATAADSAALAVILSTSRRWRPARCKRHIERGQAVKRHERCFRPGAGQCRPGFRDHGGEFHGEWQEITIATTDTLKSVFDQISTATAGR